jgi:hypothetical protein
MTPQTDPAVQEQPGAVRANGYRRPSPPFLGHTRVRDGRWAVCGRGGPEKAARVSGLDDGNLRVLRSRRSFRLESGLGGVEQSAPPGQQDPGGEHSDERRRKDNMNEQDDWFSEEDQQRFVNEYVRQRGEAALRQAVAEQRRHVRVLEPFRRRALQRSIACNTRPPTEVRRTPRERRPAGRSARSCSSRGSPGSDEHHAAEIAEIVRHCRAVAAFAGLAWLGDWVRVQPEALGVV